MKMKFRITAAVLLAAFVSACSSPYMAQMQALDAAYDAGRISQREYDREVTRLQMADASWQQSNANAATTAAVVGVAALGVAALANNHHHHDHYSRGYYHRGHYHPYRYW